MAWIRWGLPTSHPPLAILYCCSQHFFPTSASSTAAIVTPTFAMGKGNGAKPKQSPKSSRMFPSLHQKLVDAVSEHINDLAFHEEDSHTNVNKESSTFVMGHFRCYSPTCPTRAWSSGKVTILIRSYEDGSYNAVVFKQRCRGCKRLGKLTMDETSYINRVHYRLLHWAGVAQERPVYRPRASPPHESNLCEGCKRGICRAGNMQIRY